jgi:dTDP-glucose pyrophosphorylase
MAAAATVRKAVLLAAGRGTRLGALAEDVPKPLLEVAGTPLIGHLLRGLAQAGITQVTVVTGHLADALEGRLGDGGEWGVALRYVRQDTLDGTATALGLAREWLGDEPFFFGWGDILVRPEDYAAVLQAAAAADAVIAVNHVDDPWAGAAVYVDPDGRVTRIIEKPARGSSTTSWNNAGFGVLGPAIWPIIERLAPSPRGEYELPRAIAALAEGGALVRAVPVTGPWFDIGTPESLAAARAEWGA